MASQLGFSEFFKNEDNINNKPNRRRNRTIKKKEKKESKVTNLLNSMNGISTFNEDDSDNLANFTPPPKPQITKQPQQIINNPPFNTQVQSSENYKNIAEMNVVKDEDEPVSVEGYGNLDNAAERNEFYKTYLPYYSQPSNTKSVHSSQDDLMVKLNYMIQLLEENKDEKTDNVTEELVLYMFLGVFVIFIVDSFARAGKYTR